MNIVTERRIKTALRRGCGGGKERFFLGLHSTQILLLAPMNCVGYNQRDMPSLKLRQTGGSGRNWTSHSPTPSLRSWLRKMNSSGGATMANKEQGSSKNIKKVAKMSLKEKRALKREKRENKI